MSGYDNNNWTKPLPPVAYSFGTIAVSGQSNVVADTTSDTLTLVAGSNITITTDAGTDSVTINASGGGISDGDKGDITVSGSGTTWTVDNDVITFAKMQNINTGKILGRTSASSGDIEELSAGTGIAISGGSISTTITQYTDEMAQDAVGTILTDSSTVDFTYNDVSDTITASVISNSSTQKIEITKNSGAVVGTRKQLNFIEGSNITLTVADDAGNDQIDVTIASSGGGNTFSTIAVSGQSDVVADSTTDTLTLVAGSNITLTTNATTDTITIAASGGGSASITQTEVDFGSTPVSSATFTITDAGVSGTSQIMAIMAYEAPTGKDLDECEMDKLDIICAPASGQFDMLISAVDGSYLEGKFKINYLVG